MTAPNFAILFALISLAFFLAMLGYYYSQRKYRAAVCKEFGHEWELAENPYKYLECKRCWKELP